MADIDLWLKHEVRPSNGFKYYSYILCYVDDILCIHHDSMAVLNKLEKYFKLKPGLTGDPDMCLWAKLCRITLRNGAVTWGMSPLNYLREAAKNCANYVKDNFPDKYTFPDHAENPFVMVYEAVMDTSKALDPAEASYFQFMISVMRWMVEIGRIVSTVVSPCLSSKGTS